MNRPQFLRGWWLVPVGIVVALIALFSVFQTSGESRARIALRDFVEQVKVGNVSEVELDGHILKYSLEDSPGVAYETELAPDDSITAILQSEGIPIEEQPIIIVDGSSGVSSWVSLFVSFLPIVIILVIVGSFLRMAGNPQKMRAQMMGLVTNVDPVCKETVNPGSSAGSSTFQSITYYFCSPQHKQQFDADPVRYLLQK